MKRWFLPVAIIPAVALAQTIPFGMDPNGGFSGINSRNAAWSGKRDVGGIYVVATLPVCNAAVTNTWAAVTDAAAPTYNSAVTGSGSARVPVYCNGSVWTAH